MPDLVSILCRGIEVAERELALAVAEELRRGLRHLREPLEMIGVTVVGEVAAPKAA
jgi:hypothetical protein